VTFEWHCQVGCSVAYDGTMKKSKSFYRGQHFRAWFSRPETRTRISLVFRADNFIVVYGSSSDLLSGFRMAAGRVGFRLVPAMRISKQSSEKFGSACCRHLS
jgi:hypothetical protein